MPISSQRQVKNRKNLGNDLEKSKKATHLESISAANLKLVKLSLDRSSKFRTGELIQDQKITYRRFHRKFLNSQVYQARLTNDKSKLKEAKHKLLNIRANDDDEQYDCFRRITNETSEEWKAWRKKHGLDNDKKKDEKDKNEEKKEVKKDDNDSDSSSDTEEFVPKIAIGDEATPSPTSTARRTPITPEPTILSESRLYAQSADAKCRFLPKFSKNWLIILL